MTTATMVATSMVVRLLRGSDSVRLRASGLRQSSSVALRRRSRRARGAARNACIVVLGSFVRRHGLAIAAIRALARTSLGVWPGRGRNKQKKLARPRRLTSLLPTLTSLALPGLPSVRVAGMAGASVTRRMGAAADSWFSRSEAAACTRSGGNETPMPGVGGASSVVSVAALLVLSLPLVSRGEARPVLALVGAGACSGATATAAAG